MKAKILIVTLAAFSAAPLFADQADEMAGQTAEGKGGRCSVSQF